VGGQEPQDDTKKTQEESKAIQTQTEKKGLKNNTVYVKEYNRLLEQHNLPISRMGDIDWHLRQRFVFDSECEDKHTLQLSFYLRDPALSDDDNF
jgi:hypothetical protein